MPRDSRSAAIGRIRSWNSLGASPMDGSSSSSTFGRVSSARPMDTICCCPPESVPARRVRNSLMRGRTSSTSSMRSFWPDAGTPADQRARPKISSTVRSGKTPRPSGTSATPSAPSAAGLWFGGVVPKMRMLPAEGRCSPNSTRSSVDLPAPLWPMRQRISPALSVRETSCSTSRPPKPADRPVAWMAVSAVSWRGRSTPPRPSALRRSGTLTLPPAAGRRNRWRRVRGP